MIKDVTTIKNLADENYLRLFRIDFRGLRLYVQPDPFMYFSGLTGALSAAKFKGDPDERRLTSWRESFIDSYGKEAQRNYVDMTAEFGTLLHEALVTIKESKKIDWGFERDKADAYFTDVFLKQQQVPNVFVISKMVYEYQKHVASMMQFVYDRVSDIYAIETPVIWLEHKIATPVDLVCKCRQTPKGDLSDTVINIKTSSQIGKGHLQQVACELIAWNETYGRSTSPINHICDHAAILRTKDWTEGKTPTYDYKYMDAGAAIECTEDLGARLKLCLNSDATYYPEPTYKAFEGETEIGSMPNVIIRSLEQEWGEYWKKQKDNA